MKYGMWLDEWFRNYIQPSSKIKTCERYSEIIEKHLKVKLGEYELDELTPLVSWILWLHWNFLLTDMESDITMVSSASRLRTDIR